jgi:flavin reductase (DIM6/NTAB) family NADH-FMN oxidoreductase RutF
VTGEKREMRVGKSLVEATDYPLYVVTASAESERSGCLAGFVTQSSIEPVQFLVCISKINHTFPIALRANALALHLLGSDQNDLASIFGELSGDDVDKFATVPCSPGVTGAPVLSECAAWVEGPVLRHLDVGDHEAFLIGLSGGGAGDHKGRFMLHDAAGFTPGHPE